MFYISQHLVFKHRVDLQGPEFEHLWVDVKIQGKLFAIYAFYRPPNNSADEQNRFLSFSKLILDKLNSHPSTHKVIASDLNFGNCYCKYPILEPKPLDTRAPDLFSSRGFTQIIDIPTRTTQNTLSLIDLIFTNTPEDIVVHGTLPKIADHDGIICSFNIIEQRAKPRKKTMHDYKNIDLIGLRRHIKEYDFTNTVFTLPVAEQVQAYTQVITYNPCRSQML
jgi:hypothetical protein